MCATVHKYYIYILCSLAEAFHTRDICLFQQQPLYDCIIHFVCEHISLILNYMEAYFMRIGFLCALYSLQKRYSFTQQDVQRQISFTMAFIIQSVFCDRHKEIYVNEKFISYIPTIHIWFYSIKVNNNYNYYYAL